MNMIICTDGIELTESLERYAAQKLDKLSRFNPIAVHCLMKIDNRDCIVELRADDSFVTAKCKDMYSSVVKAVDTMKVMLNQKKQQR